MAYGTVNADLMTTSDGVSSSGLYGFKNRIINGAMMIDQRNAGASVTPNNSYTLDRWKIENSQTGKLTAQQTPSATETGYATRVGAGFTNYLAVTSSSAYSIGASDYFILEQMVEGFNLADLGWGTSSAKPITISFWVYSSLTGTFSGALNNSASNRSYTYTYSIPVANTWTYITVTIAGDQSGTWVTNNGIGAYVRWSFGVGSTFQTATGSWTTGNYFGVSGATSVVGTNGATWYITGVQLEKGSTATSFDYRPYGTELQLCQRYFVSLQEGIWTANGSGTATAGIYMPVTMRATPTLYATPTVITIWDPQIGSYAQSSASGSLPIGGPSKDFVIIQCGNFSGMTTGRMLFWQSGGSIQLGAEL